MIIHRREQAGEVRKPKYAAAAVRGVVLIVADRSKRETWVRIPDSFLCQPPSSAGDSTRSTASFLFVLTIFDIKFQHVLETG